MRRQFPFDAGAAMVATLIMFVSSQFATAKDMADAKSGAKPADAQAAGEVKPKVPTIAICNFRGPLNTRIDTNLVYKIKVGRISDPDPGDFAYLGGNIAKKLIAQLKAKYGDDGVIHLRAASDDDDDVAVRKKDARYILKGTIDEIRFEANVLLGPWYSIRVSSKLVSSDSGDTLWRMSNKQFQHFYKSDANKEVADVFAELVVPQVVEKISTEVTQTLDNQ